MAEKYIPQDNPKQYTGDSVYERAKKFLEDKDRGGTDTSEKTPALDQKIADAKAKETKTNKVDQEEAKKLINNTYPTYSAAKDSQKANEAMKPPTTPNMDGLTAPVAAPARFVSNETIKPLDLSSDFFKKISEKGVNGEYLINDMELAKYKDSLKSLLKLPNEPIKLDAAQDGKSLSIINDITGFTVKIDNKGNILAFGTPNTGKPNKMQNFVDTLAQGIQSPLAVPVSTKPAPQKEIVTNTLISENKIREVFGIKPDQKMDERLKSITQETLDAISNRGMKMIRYSDDARAGGIIYNINITEKGSTSPKAYEGKILFKYPDININKELTRASRLPETELKYASITNNSAIEYLEGRAIFMKDDIYAVDQNGVISKKNYIKLGEDLEIYNYTINGSRLDLSLYNTNTMDRSKRTLVVGSDGSISADGKIVARKRNITEQGIINAAIDVENKKPSLGDILPKSKDKLGQEGTLKIDPANVAILQRAEAAGFTFENSNSRTNSINIYDKSGTKIENIITMYGQGQKTLIEFLTKTVK